MNRAGVRGRLPAVALAALVLVVLGCGEPSAEERDRSSRHREGEAPGSQASAVPGEEAPKIELEASDSLRLRLSDAEPSPSTVARPAGVSAEPLDGEELTALVARLPPREEPLVEEREMVLPSTSRPLPRRAERIEEDFPASEEGGGELHVPAEADDRPLEIERRFPEGEVSMAPHVSLTFNQPMVEVTGHDDAASNVPVRISPEVDGSWRWVGTRTLLFEGDGPLPMATNYQVTVPAETTSLSGAGLGHDVSWRFITPAPTVKSVWPRGGDTHPLDTVMVLVFDQPVDTSGLLPRLRVVAGGNQYQVVKAAASHIDSSAEARRLVGEAKEDTFLAFRATEPFPFDSSVRITVPAGTASLEGPLTTYRDYSRSFKTQGPLKVVDHRCLGGCAPDSKWRVKLSNPIDEDVFDAAGHVRIEPEPAASKVTVRGREIVVDGVHRSNTTYEILLSPNIRDNLGQSLGETEPLEMTVGRARPTFLREPRILTVLDPQGSGGFELHTRGMESLLVTMRAVSPEDWRAYELWRWREVDDLPGEIVTEEIVEVEGDIDDVSTTEIDLREALDEAKGQLLLGVEDAGEVEDERRRQGIHTWIQRTRLGLVAWRTDSLEVLVTCLSKGEPVADVRLSLLHDDGHELPIEVSTSELGTARLPLDQEPVHVLVARHEKDLAILPAGGGVPYRRGWRWGHWKPYDRLLWYTTNDRGIYRPGERVHVKGWLRLAEGGPEGDIAPVGDSVRAVSWAARDSRQEEIAKGRATVDGHGGFSFHVDVPEDSALGGAGVSLKVEEGEIESTWRHSFRVQDFRRPELKIAVTAGEAPHILGERVRAEVRGTYYTGEPLPKAQVEWRLRTSPASYRPPGNEDFSFGRPVPMWARFGRALYRSDFERSSFSHSAVTGFDGKHELAVDLAGGPPFPVSVRAAASVRDLNRQGWSGSVPLLIHPASVYVGLSSDGFFMREGEDLEVDIVVVDLDGRPVEDIPVEVTAERIEWKRPGSSAIEVLGSRSCERSSEEEHVSCIFENLEGGRWRIEATAEDAMGRPSRTRIDRWVTGEPRAAEDRVAVEEMTLIPQKEEWVPGEMARVLVRLPFHPAELVVSTINRGGASSERLRVEGPEHTIEVPITEAMTPGPSLHVLATGTAPRDDPAGDSGAELPKRPAFAQGRLALSVPPEHRRLEVEAIPAMSEVQPGGGTTVEIMVRDAEGDPVEDAQVLVAAVDEAVLSLSNHRLRDAMDFFYRRRPFGVMPSSLYPSVMLEDLGDRLDLLHDDEKEGGRAPPERRRTQTIQVIRRPGDGKAPSVSEDPPPALVSIREDLDPLALFAPDVTTSADGRAEVKLELPDSLTRYRIMAVATDGARRFGSAESTITARLPLMVRPSLPRFLNEGDEAELPFLVQNGTESDLTVSFAMVASGLETGNGAVGRRFSVPARERVEVRLPARAEEAGRVTVRAVAVAGDHADAAAAAFPVWTPATKETFATYGTIDAGAAVQPVSIPKSARSDTGGLEVSASSTALGGLTDAVVYLSRYPFRGTEQLASRVLAFAAMHDVLQVFEAEGLPDRDELREAVARDLETIYSRQSRSGAFGTWRRPQSRCPDRPYVTVYTALALTVAEEKGFELSEEVLEGAVSMLESIERCIPARYGAEARSSIRALSLYVLHRRGRDDAESARELIAEVRGRMQRAEEHDHRHRGCCERAERQGVVVEDMNLEMLGWLLPVLASDPHGSAEEIQAIVDYVGTRAVDTASGVTFRQGYEKGSHLILHSRRRTDALLLKGLMSARPRSDLIPKIVESLMAGRTRGRWSGTQENAWALLALDGYFRRYERSAPSFVARAWLGDELAAEHSFRGRTSRAGSFFVPMSSLDERNGSVDLTLEKAGPGRMYYRVGMTYVPDDFTPPPIERGFTVERSYEAVDDPQDLWRDEDGVWRARAGARIRVRVTMVAPSRRHHVALVDPLPAGLEILNPALAVTEPLPPDPGPADDGRDRRWRRIWYDHQNLRAQRAEVFASHLPPGVHDYSYVTVATTPGTFIASPAKAEEMYRPETFGRGRGELFVVEPPSR